MIPEKLILKGVYSYREAQTIDFNHLTQAGLFGIFGAVGSGKSTILEAICYALYGDLERMNSRDSRNYNLMNLNSNELKIEFQFKAGKENKTWLATVEGKRNSRNHADVKTLERNAYCLENGNWKPVNTDEIKNAIGLTYENFTKTIIIPQGKFAGFMQMTGTERIRLMKDLFSLEKYEFSGQVLKLENENDLQLSATQGRLAELQSATPEAIAETNRELFDKVQQKTETALNLQQLTEETQILKETKAIFEQKAHAERELKTLQEQEGHFNNLESELNNYENCLHTFDAPLKQKADTQNRIIKTTAELNKLQKEKAEKTNLLNRTQVSFNLAEIEFLKRDSLLESASNWEQAAKILENQKKQAIEENSLARASEIMPNQLNLIKTLKNSIQTLSEEENNLLASIKDEAILNPLQAWLIGKKNLADNANGFEQQKLQLRSEVENEKAKLPSVIPTSLNDALAKAGIDLKAPINEKLSKLKSWLNTAISENTKLQTELGIKQKLKEYAHSLHDGEACPLCGSLEHPQILQSDWADDELKKAQQDLKSLQLVGQQIDKAQTAFTQITTKIEGLQNQLVQLDNSLNKSQADILEHNTQFVWPGYEDFTLATTQELIKQNQSFRRAADAKKTDIVNKQNTLKLEEDKYRRMEARVIEINTNLTQINATIATLQAAAPNLNLTQYINYTPEQCTAEALRIKGNAEQDKLNYNNLSDSLKQLQISFQGLEGSLNVVKANLENEQNSLKSQNQSLAQIIRENGYQNEEEIVQILNRKLESTKIRSEINNFRSMLTSARDQFNRCVTLAEGKTYNPEYHAAQEASKLDMEGKLAILQQNIGALENRIDDLTKRLKDKERQQKILEGLEARGKDITTLKSLFSSSGFVKFLLQHKLEMLCEVANQRFEKLTRQRLSLYVNENQDFWVIDRLSEGRKRSAKTLSGGQTFQAALSLALAMADSIRATTQVERNFFFLDEGFGSQDKESLRIVFDTLKQLRHENRIVGIISHVEELQQEIDTAIKIVNDDEKGSQVKVLG